MTETLILLGTTITLAFFHTLIGIDHYLPFIALSKSNNWTIRKTIFVVLICGFGHILSSVILGIIGIALFFHATAFDGIQDIREDIATYILIAFGIIYSIYGIISAVKNKPHSHSHNHELKKTGKAFWGLLIIFVIGACKPMIPLMMKTAAENNVFTLVLVTVCFSVVTVGIMLVMTLLGLKGFRLIRTDKLERYAHFIAGCVVLACGLLVLFLPF